MADIRLDLFTVPVIFLDGSRSTARAEGNNAAWHCKCSNAMPLLGRCYFQFGHNCHTICPDCNRSYRVDRDADKRTSQVVEFQRSLID